MSAHGVARAAASAALVAWILKAVAIGVAGGLDQSPLEGPLFLLGLLFLVTAAGAFALAVTTGRSLVLQIVSVVVGVGASLVLIAALTALGEMLPDSAGWVRSEAGLWLVALVMFGLAFWWPQRQTSGVAGRLAG